MKTKACTQCHKVYIESHFYSDIKRDGKERILQQCKKCREYKKKFDEKYYSNMKFEFESENKRRCFSCLKIKDLNEFPMKKNGKNERIKICFPCREKKVKSVTPEYLKRVNERTKYRKENEPGYREKLLKQLHDYQNILTRTPKRAYSQYKFGSVTRKKEFLLSFEEFMEFWNKPCYYCGDPIPTIGLDRIKNEIGYQKDNIIPCCTLCNKIKSTLSQDVFFKQCLKISNKYIIRRNEVDDNLAETLATGKFLT